MVKYSRIWKKLFFKTVQKFFFERSSQRKMRRQENFIFRFFFLTSIQGFPISLQNSRLFRMSFQKNPIFLSKSPTQLVYWKQFTKPQSSYNHPIILKDWVIKVYDPNKNFYISQMMKRVREKNFVENFSQKKIINKILKKIFSKKILFFLLINFSGKWSIHKFVR